MATKGSLTERERELLKALGDAIDTYQFASMNTYERDCFREEMKNAEAVHAKYLEEE